ncbi:hypothetical protein PHMEG_00028510 [Phytophthora megakarya]|uniref:Uncharacterized protein n=1 Tax=Phytophthora megakarya TaxID=4795 RepID=A0A225V2Z8_9STRA|nr:hypothetical protein PHMEG_00028510 [Phytophthora megakarya]
MFGWRESVDAKPHIGKETDEVLLILGMMSKRLLRSTASDPSTVVLRVDATFKLKSSYYPVMVINVSDRLGIFHLLALFIVSEGAETVYVEVLGRTVCSPASLVRHSKLIV